MKLLEQTCQAIVPPDAEAARQAQAHLDAKTKPRGSLGRLEEIACRIAAVRGTGLPDLPRKAVVVMAADHGVTEEGISAYPREVTAQMLLNFARGGAGINVLARAVGARVIVVDMGVANAPSDLPNVLSRRVEAGTRNFTREPAMSHEQARRALEAGIEVATTLAREGFTLIGLGEMGIGNTTAASALVAAYTRSAVEEVTGRGTGVDDDGWRRKVDAIRRGLARHQPIYTDGLGTLAQLGGFEIAGLAGVVLGAAAHRIPVLVDGFITAAAALAAVRIAPQAASYLLAAHMSVEPGHRCALEALGQRPLLDLGLRLGEGTGGALAMGLVEASLRVLHEMATFADAGVSDSGR
jgi:nicotinate-nucleotide--dimethylbenzimidazole phosphoribosyltransferase